MESRRPIEKLAIALGVGTLKYLCRQHGAFEHHPIHSLKALHMWIPHHCWQAFPTEAVNKTVHTTEERI
jgi:hypothetical protein